MCESTDAGESRAERHDGRSNTRRWAFAAGAVFLCLVAVVLLPLMFAFVQSPMQSRDLLTGPHMFYSPKGDFTSLREVLPNYGHAVLKSTYLVRPTQVLVNNLQYVAFGPSTGALYAVKWAMKFASAILVLVVLKLLDADACGRYAAAALVLFHPACLDPLLWSADGLAAFFMLAMIATSLWFARPTGGTLLVDRITGWQCAALFGGWFLLLGAKEIAFVICGCLVLAWHLPSIRSRRAWARLTPFYFVLAFWSYRLSTARPRSAYSSAFADLGRRILDNFQLVIPPSPYNSLGWVYLVLIGLAAFHALRNRDAAFRMWFALFAAAATAGTIFISVPAVPPGARYTIVPVYLFSMLVGLGMSGLPRIVWPAKLSFLLLLPAWMAGDLYSQTLALVREMEEYNDALSYLESGAAQGYSIACSGDSFEIEGMFGREPQETVKYYFEKYGPEFFGLATPRNVYLLRDGDRPKSAYRLMTTYSPATLHGGAIHGVSTAQVRAAVQIEHRQDGFLPWMTNRYLRLAHCLGNDHWPVYDTGTFPPTGKPRYFLYTVDPIAEASGGHFAVARIQPPPRPRSYFR